MKNISYLKDEIQDAKAQFISFKGDNKRFDLVIFTSPFFGEDKIVLDLNTNKYSKLNQETIEKTSDVEHALHYNEMEADEFRLFVKPLLKSDS